MIDIDELKPEPPAMPECYVGMADKDRLRKLADELSAGTVSNSDAAATMLRLVAQHLEDSEEKPPLPAKWGTIVKGCINPYTKQRFIDIIGEDKLTEMALTDYRIVALERKIRELETSVTGDDGIVAVAWRKALAAKKEYLDAHRERENTWRRIVAMRAEQRSRLEKLMKDELVAKVEKTRATINRNFIQSPKGSNIKHDRRRKERRDIIPREIELPLVNTGGEPDGENQ